LEGWKKEFYKGIIFSSFGVISSLFLTLIVSSATEFDLMVNFLPFFYPIILGFKKLSYAWRHKKDEIFYVSGGLYLYPNSLKKLVEASIFGGSGTHEDPYRIINFSNLPSRIIIRKLDSYILLEGLYLMFLSIKSCRNVLINNNTIKKLILNSCSDLVLTNNSITTIKIEFCFGSVIQGNEVSPLDLQELESSQLNVKRMSYVGEVLFLIICPFSIIYGSYMFILNGLYLVLIVFTPLILLLYPNYRSIRRKHRYNRSIVDRPNIVISNYLSL